MKVNLWQPRAIVTETHEAAVDKIQSLNDRKVVLLTVDGPDFFPKRFMELTSNRRVKRLNDLTELQVDKPGLKIGGVPVQYNDGWKIAWGEF